MGSSDLDQNPFGLTEIQRLQSEASALVVAHTDELIERLEARALAECVEATARRHGVPLSVALRVLSA